MRGVSSSERGAFYRFDPVYAERAMKRRTALCLVAGLLQVACASPPVTDDETGPKLREYGEPGDPVITYSFEIVGADVHDVRFVTSTWMDDVDCKQGPVAVAWSPGEIRPTRGASPKRALYELHLCFEIGERTYRGWRGFDPGRGSRIELACRVDAREPPPETYACKTTKLEVNPENYGEGAYACRGAEPCRRFESEPEYLGWKALPILTREEILAATAALIRHEFASAAQPSWLSSSEDYYVSVAGQDLPRDLAASLSRRGYRFHPASEQADHEGTSMNVGKFLRRPDGTMQVDYSYYCGPLCASGNTAILKKNAAGEWEVVSTQQHWVS